MRKSTPRFARSVPFAGSAAIALLAAGPAFAADEADDAVDDSADAAADADAADATTEAEDQPTIYVYGRGE